MFTRSSRLLTRINQATVSAQGWARQLDTLRRAEASYVLLIVAIGVLGGLVGLLFRLGLNVFQVIYFASSESIVTIVQNLSWQTRLAAPAGGALIAALVIKYGLKGGPSEGMSEIMEAVVLKEKALRVRPALWKALASLVTLGSGGSLGREGPMAQVSAAAAGRLSEFLHISAERQRILMGCGVAAGMAAAYNAPIGASLFVMEVIIGNFAMDIFGPLVVSSVVATIMTRGTVGGAIYEVPEFRLISTWEFVPYVLLGIACAVVGRLFMEGLFGFGWLFGKLRLPIWMSAAIGGLGVGAIGIWTPWVWGNGQEGVDRALRGEFPLEILALVLAGKMLATWLTIGSGAPGGVFTPTIFLGAMLGGVVGEGAHTLWPNITAPPGAYALVGMSGLLASTTHAPIMSTLMVFEMSLNYNLILPVMVCSGISALLSRALKRDSIYTARLRRRGVDIDLAIEESALQSIQVADVMWTNPPTVRPSAPLRALLDQFLHMRGGMTIHVVDEKDRYIGLIDVHDLVAAADQKEVADLLIAGDLARMVPHVKPGEPVSNVTEKFWFQEHGEIPVLSADEPPRFLGVVTRRDVLRAFDREVLQRKLLTVRYSQPGAERSQRRSMVDLPAEFAIEEIPVPASLAGRTLMDLDLPHKYLLTVLSLKPAGDSAEIIPPPADRVLGEGDRLVLVGKRQDLARFARA
ncbi:MAG TPA: chloride channel protein [Candidatus Polarisedimenticolia bacterium]|nr:chloride channel protein [Candidatus Polarisedimenticolia bacterium]